MRANPTHTLELPSPGDDPSEASEARGEKLDIGHAPAHACGRTDRRHLRSNARPRAPVDSRLVVRELRRIERGVAA
jgi:hypothetical protein